MPKDTIRIYIGIRTIGFSDRKWKILIKNAEKMNVLITGWSYGPFAPKSKVLNVEGLRYDVRRYFNWLKEHHFSPWYEV